MFIYQAIDSGMVSFLDVKAGRVSLADIAEINHYLSLKADVEYSSLEKAKVKRHGRRC